MARGAVAAEQLRIAEAALAAGRFPEAAEALSKAVRLDPDSPRPRLMLAYALWQSEQRDEAILVLRRLIERSPGNADAWFNLGNFYRAERQFQDAVRAFARAAQLQPGNAAARVNLAYVLVQSGRFDEAEVSVRSALEIFPDEADLLVNLAQIQRATQRSREAVATLDRCVALAPAHPGYRVTRALARLDLGEQDQALPSSTASFAMIQTPWRRISERRACCCRRGGMPKAGANTYGDLQGLAGSPHRGNPLRRRLRRSKSFTASQ